MQSREFDTFRVIGPSVMALVGLFLVLGGLVRLFGLSRMTISSEKIRFQTTLLGIGPRWTLPTAEVISVGSPTDPRTRSGQVIGPAKGRVIRTATKEIRYGDPLRDAVRNQAEADWLIGEIALRIHAARSGAGLPSIRHRRPNAPPHPVNLAPKPPPEGPVPYEVHERPMPSGHNLDILLPVDVGPFRRETFGEPDRLENGPIEVEYQSDRGRIFVTLVICPDSDRAGEAVAVSEAEATTGGARSGNLLSLNTEPSFCRHATPRGAFMAWARHNYYFSASVHGGNSEELLDRFMKAFPF
jgi:hypothetical protein